MKQQSGKAQLIDKQLGHSINNQCNYINNTLLNMHDTTYLDRQYTQYYIENKHKNIIQKNCINHKYGLMFMSSLFNIYIVVKYHCRKPSMEISIPKN